MKRKRLLRKNHLRAFDAARPGGASSAFLPLVYVDLSCKVCRGSARLPGVGRGVCWCVWGNCTRAAHEVYAQLREHGGLGVSSSSQDLHNWIIDYERIARRVSSSIDAYSLGRELVRVKLFPMRAYAGS